MMNKDLIIIGAGPSALALAKALAHSRLNITLIEQQSQQQCAQPDYDGRDIALTHQSLAILKQFDIWSKLQAHPIAAAKVQDGHSPYTLNFCEHTQPLGFLVSNHHLRQALYETVAPQPNVNFIWQTKVQQVIKSELGYRVTLCDGRQFDTPLLVAADSRFSATRRQVGISATIKDFARTAIVCRMRHQLAHQCTAHECFHYGHTLAILPLSEGESSIVVTANTDKAADLLALSDDEFSRFITDALAHRLGDMQLSTVRFSYPLVGVFAAYFSKAHVALLGDAAVGMHPVTAHGFNLGLVGATRLAKVISEAIDKNDPYYSEQTLAAYHSEQQKEARMMYYGTNGIVQLFTSENPPAKLARKILLRFSNHFPPLKQAITAKLTQYG